MTRQIVNRETPRSTVASTIKIEIKTNCWICGKEIKEGELFVGTLKKDARHFYHVNCWKEPEKHGWMV